MLLVKVISPVLAVGWGLRVTYYPCMLAGQAAIFGLCDPTPPLPKRDRSPRTPSSLEIMPGHLPKLDLHYLDINPEQET